MRIPSILRHLLTSVSAILLALGLSEIAVRLCNPQPIRPAMYQADPLYGRTTIPRLGGYWKEPEFSHAFQLNSLGFRDRERALRKPANTVRIIGLGDSFSWGVGVEQHETFLQQLEDTLNQSEDGMSHEVLNWGVPGWGTAQELLCLKHQAPAYHPDLVLIQYFKDDDLADNVYKSPFRLTDEAGAVTHSADREPNVSRLIRATRYVPFYRVLTQHSQLLSLLRARLIIAAEQNDRRPLANTIPGDSFAYGLQLTEALLDELFSYTESVGWTTAMLIIPRKGELSASSAGRDSGRRRRALDEARMLDDVCRRHNIPRLDLSESFSQKDVSLLYYSIDEHLTPYGHKVTAEATARFLNTHRLMNEPIKRASDVSDHSSIK